MSTNARQKIEVVSERIRGLIARLSEADYDAAREHAVEFRALAHEYMSLLLEAPLNRLVKEKPHGNLLEKRAVAAWVNEELRPLGLAIRCPKTGLPTTLQTGPSHIQGQGRFLLAPIESAGGIRSTRTFVNLIDLELMAHPHRREPLAEHWARWRARRDAEGVDR